jgi:hypothetical protein
MESLPRPLMSAQISLASAEHNIPEDDPRNVATIKLTTSAINVVTLRRYGLQIYLSRGRGDTCCHFKPEKQGLAMGLIYPLIVPAIGIVTAGSSNLYYALAQY